MNDTERALAPIAALLDQAFITGREAERRAAQWESRWQAVTKERDGLTEANIKLWSAKEALEKWRDQPERAQRITQLMEMIVKLEQERDIARAHVERDERLNDELSAELDQARHAASEVRIGARAANNAMYCAIERERAAQAELKQCAAAHQKASEQVEHYGVALTQLAIAGNPIANEALGSAPHQDRIVALFRERTAYLAKIEALTLALDEQAELQGGNPDAPRVSSHNPASATDPQEETQALVALRAAYIRMLQLPFGTFRIESQHVLGMLRDAIADAEGLSSLEVQNTYEHKARVSSTGVGKEPAQAEETQAQEELRAAYLKSTSTTALCPRCQRPLDTPGIAGGFSVCTSCLALGEAEKRGL